MNRRRVWLNLGLGVVVLALAGAGLVALATPREDPSANLPTATVRRGSLEATVTASGNIESGVTAALQLPGTGGTITKVSVRTGQRVTRGEELLRIDDTSAQAQLDTALVSLKSAEASLQTATQGRTEAERRSDSASVASAEQTLRNAEKALAAAKDSRSLTTRQQADLVAAAKEAVSVAEQTLATNTASLAQLKDTRAATDPADTATIADLDSRIATLETQVVTAKAAVPSAKAAYAQAKRARDTAVQQASQSVTSQTGARDSAKKALAQTKATVAVSRQGPKAGSVNAAKAQVESAQLGVDQARRTLDDTVLVAPFSGIVSTVNAVVGQSSSSVASAAGTGSSGLVTLVNPDGLRVSAAIAEADATAVKVGQLATINLPASAIEMAGEVVSVDVQSTVANNVVQYLTTVSLVDPPSQVRVGQTASLSIVTGSKADVLFVSTSAITTEGASSYVQRMVNGMPSRAEVTLGLVGTTATEIVSGLAEGDKVLLPSGGSDTAAFPAPGGTTPR